MPQQLGPHRTSTSEIITRARRVAMRIDKLLADLEKQREREQPRPLAGASMSDRESFDLFQTDFAKLEERITYTFLIDPTFQQSVTGTEKFKWNQVTRQHVITEMLTLVQDEIDKQLHPSDDPDISQELP